jgi:hypothetical protein
LEYKISNGFKPIPFDLDWKSIKEDL